MTDSRLAAAWRTPNNGLPIRAAEREVSIIQAGNFQRKASIGCFVTVSGNMQHEFQCGHEADFTAILPVEEPPWIGYHPHPAQVYRKFAIS